MAGLSALAILFGVPVGVPELLTQFIAGACGLASIFMPERWGAS